MRSREAWTEPKKKDGEMVPQVSPIELSPNREALEPPTQVVNTQTSSGSQKSLPIAFNHTGERVGTSYPIGPIMKVKYFRLNIVFESSVTVLWALVYVPGLPIRKQRRRVCSRLHSRCSLRTSAVHHYERCLHEPGQQRSVGALRVWTPLARNLNPGDGVFLVWQALTSASSIPTIVTINYSSCVN